MTKCQIGTVFDFLVWTNCASEGENCTCDGTVRYGWGATWVERHVTMDRNMWGSDQKSSVEPSGLFKLVKGIRDIEKATQYEPAPRKQFNGENLKRESLRKNNNVSVVNSI